MIILTSTVPMIFTTHYYQNENSCDIKSNSLHITNNMNTLYNTWIQVIQTSEQFPHTQTNEFPDLSLTKTTFHGTLTLPITLPLQPPYFATSLSLKIPKNNTVSRIN